MQHTNNKARRLVLFISSLLCGLRLSSSNETTTTTTTTTNFMDYSAAITQLRGHFTKI